MYDNYTLARFFDNKTHAEEFMSGKLRVGRIRYYRELESEDGRGDPNEGVSSLCKPGDGTLQLGVKGEEMRTIEDFITMKLAHNADLESHVLCTTKVFYEKGKNRVDIQIRDLGRLLEDFCNSNLETAYVVFISRPQAFVDRVSRTPQFGGAGPVTYDDFDAPRKTHWCVDVFLKDKKYQHQREVRFKFNLPETVRGSHSTIDIGDISDIAFLIKLSDHKLIPE